MEKESEKIQKSLKLSVKEGAVASAMPGFGDNYISPFAIAQGASNIQVGLLTSLPNLFGPAFQLASLKRLESGVSRKSIVLRSVFFHAFMLLPILLIPFIFDKGRVEILLVLFTLYAIFGWYGGAAWGSWMGDLVPSEERGRYFGKRNRICGAVTLSSTFIAGWILNYFVKSNIFLGFALIFFAAMVARFTSFYLLTKQYEPELVIDKRYYFTLYEFVKRINDNNFGRFVMYISLLNFAVNIAGPFFAVYMLRDLHYSYLSYTIVILTAGLTEVLSMPFWGRIGDKYGNVKVMKICGWLVAFLPLYWIFAPNIYWILLIQVISGFSWSGLNLTHLNFIYDTVTQQRRAICMSYLNILRGICVFVGALLGGIIATKVSFGAFWTGIFVVFLLSGILRIILGMVLLPKLKETRLIGVGKPTIELGEVVPGRGFAERVLHTIYVGSTKIRKIRWKKWRRK